MTAGKDRHFLFERTTMLYNPEKFGAKCPECPLKNNGPAVPPQYRPKAALTIISESPGISEVESQKPLSGGFGYYIRNIAKSRGVNWKAAHVTNAIACNIPRQTKAALVNKAAACCRPRLVRELQNIKSTTALTIGKQALKALTGTDKVIQRIGAPIQGIEELSKFTVIPATWPTNEQTPMFRTCMERAVKLAQGELPEWTYPELFTEVTQTTLKALKEMRAAKLPVGYDVETLGMDPIHSPLMCIGLANRNAMISVPWAGYDTSKYGFSAALLDYKLGPEIEAEIRGILADPEITKIAHNCQHDLLTAQYQGIDIQGPVEDTLIGHHTVYPELKHDLGYVTSHYFHMPKWKADFKVTTDAKGLDVFVKRDPLELRAYNAKDAYACAILWPRILADSKDTHNGEDLYAGYMACDGVALKMRKWGSGVDHEARLAHRGPLVIQRNEAQELFNKLTKQFYKEGDNNIGTKAKPVDAGAFNLNSPTQLGVLFFKRMRIKPTHWSKDTGEPSTNVSFLTKLTSGPNQLACEIAKALLSYREADKIISTYIDDLPILSDGRMHSSFRSYGTVTGRWSSQDINMQNLPKDLRNIIIPKEGNWIVAADYSQLELIAIALIAGVEFLIDAYKNGKDVHRLTAMSCFGHKTPGDVPDKHRQMAKGVEYGFNYNYSDDVTSVYEAFKIDTPNIKYRQVQFFRKKWFELCPEILDNQKRLLREAHALGYVEEIMTGRRRKFYDGRIDPNQVLNYPVQSFAGWLMNQTMIDLDKEISWTDEGIIAQVHDAAYLDVPDVHRGAALLTKHMVRTVTLNGNTLDFPIDIEIGKNMRDLKPYAAYLKYAEEMSVDEWYQKSNKKGLLP